MRGKMYRLIFEINKYSNIRVKTPVGLTASDRIDHILAQGSGESGIMSSVNLDRGRQDVTLVNQDGDNQVRYEDLPVPYTIYMDDLNNISEDIKTAQETNNKTEDMLESKLLSLNLQKSSYIILGERESVKALEEEANRNPLTLSGKRMERVEKVKHLGDFISNSLEESIHQTVLRRINVAKLAVFEIRAVIEDRRAQSIGGINLAFDIFNASVLSMVLYNSETWDYIGNKTLKVINDLFLLFFRNIFRVGIGTPIVTFFWQTATIKPKFQILQRTLNFIFHISNLDDTVLSKQIFNIQVAQSLPGLIEQNREHLENINFEITKNLSKWQFKKIVSEYITKLNRNELIEDSRRYKKVDTNALEKEEFKKKAYFSELNLSQVRDRFRLESKMFGNLKGNFPSQFRRRGKSLKCDLCKNILSSNTSLDITSEENTESQRHFLDICPQVRDIKSQYESDIGLNRFFKSVRERKAEMAK